MRLKLPVIVGILAAIGVVGAFSASLALAQTEVSSAEVIAFMAAGDIGGGVLEPGTLYPPADPGHATLQRGKDWVQVEINTSGLPAGAYTVWWVIFNNPDACELGVAGTSNCGVDDLLSNDTEASVLWATGGVVGDDGLANFRARYSVGDDLGIPGEQHVMGEGLLDPKAAEIHNIIKYHGPASDDPDVLYDQTHTLLVGCFENANAVDLPQFGGVHCFDPQVVIHMP